MKHVFILTLISYCICLAIGTAAPLRKVREYASKKNRTVGEFVTCPSCMALWISPFVYAFMLHKVAFEMIPLAFIAFGFAFYMELIRTKLR